MAAIGIVIRPGLSGDAAGKLLGRCRWGMAGLEERMLKHLTTAFSCISINDQPLRRELVSCL